MAARWQQRGGCGGFTGTVSEFADAHAFERHQRGDVHVLVIGRERRDNSTNGIVVVGSNGVTTVANAPPPPMMTPPTTTLLTPAATAMPTTSFVKLNLI